MLNISEHHVNSARILSKTKTLGTFKQFEYKRKLVIFLWTILALFLLALFLPWTQTIETKGQLSTLNPEHRPQTIHTTIAGRVEKWYIKEGQLVKKGDTIAYISEIKDAYFDPELLNRTGEQLDAKTQSIGAYSDKVGALENQISALNENLGLKLKQLRNKIEQLQLKIVSDSIDLEAANINLKIADEQYKRQEKLYSQGLRSLTELENRKLKYQETYAKKVSQENKLNIARNEFKIAVIDLNSAVAEAKDKISKAQSDKASANSDMFGAKGDVAKLKNQFSTYEQRRKFYYITSPQDAYIVKALTKGVGETVKEGEPIVSIQPINGELAVELYVETYNLPLIQKGEDVRVIFDGWPAIFISGWPNLSYGTFVGKVFAIDNNISDNGKFRILVSPKKGDRPWPKMLRIGTGTLGIALLNDVPVWWEIWRNLNGFPAGFYKVEEVNKQIKSNEKKGKDAK